MNSGLSAEFLNPLAPWIIEIGSPILWLGLFAYCLRESMRARSLSFGMLLLLSSTTMFWQEFYADWGAYLLYNPQFKLMPWGATFWTSPNKPWFMPASYGWYYYAAMLLMLGLVARLQARRPQWGHVTCVLVVAVPFFYAWDFALEASAAATGWWSYVYYFGPGIVTERGNFPLLHPIVMYTFYGAFMVWILGRRGVDGRVTFESCFGVERFRKGVAREAARLGAWIVYMNAVYWVFVPMPFIIVRLIFGVPDPYVP